MNECKEFRITSDVIDDCLEESLEKINIIVPPLEENKYSSDVIQA